MAFYTTKNNTYCPSNNSLYLTQEGTDFNVIRIIDCVTNTQTGVVFSNSGDEVKSKLIYNSSNNCMYYMVYNASDGIPYIRVLNCATNTIIDSVVVDTYTGGYSYSLTINQALNVIYFYNTDIYGNTYFVSVLDCATNTITTPNLLNLTLQEQNIFIYNPYFETLNIGSTIGSLLVVNTTTLQTTEYTNVLSVLNGIIYNPLDGYYYLSGELDLAPVVVRYKNGIVYGSGNSINQLLPKFLPKKNSILYIGDGEYNLFDTENLRSLGGSSANFDSSNLNIYQVGNIYDFNFLNSIIYNYDKSLTDRIQIINQNSSLPSGSQNEYIISETGGELINTGINISRPISNIYSLSSVNYTNPMSVDNLSELIFTAYDPTLNSLHFAGYSFCNFSLTNNKWENLFEAVNPSPLAMCLNTTNGFLYACIQTSNTENFQIAVINAETYELIELVNTQNTNSKYFSYDPIRNLIYSSYNNILSIIDCDTNSEINSIDLNSLLGISVLAYNVIYVENNNLIYVTCLGGSSSDCIAVLDADDYTLITTITQSSVDNYSYSSVYSPIQNKIYRPLSAGSDIEIIDCATNTSLGVVAVTTSSPYNPVYNYNDDKVYFIHVGSKNISVLDCASETTSEISSYYAGGINNSFNNGGAGFNNGLEKVYFQSDGKILVAGGFSDYNGTTANNIIRLNTNGSIDNSFITGTGFDNYVVDFKTQIDGKILVAGGFNNYNGTSTNYIVRLNSDGSIDNTFITGTGFNGTTESIDIQSDGKVICVGDFTSYDGDPSLNRIVRLNTDGSIDNTFVQGTGFDFSPLVVKIQSDNKVLVGGNFLTYNGTTANRVIRLNSDGSVDTSFVYGTGFNNYNIGAISIQDDNKIIIGGGFTEYNGTPINYIVRLNTDGSIDNTFITGIGFDGDVNTINIQDDNKIFVGGIFISYNGTPASKIIVLNSDGSVDTNYNFLIGVSSVGYVNTISNVNNGVFYIGGSFTGYDNTYVGHIASVHTNNFYITPNTPPQSIVYNGNNNSIVLFTDGVPTLSFGSYSYVYSFDCDTLSETIINQSVPYGSYTDTNNTTYSPVNNNYYRLVSDVSNNYYIIVYDGTTNLETNRVLLSEQLLGFLEYCPYNNCIYIGGDNNFVIVFDCNTNTELTTISVSFADFTNIIFNPINNLLYCIQYTSSIVVIDVTTNLEVSTIPSFSFDFYNVDSCFDLINNRIVYSVNYGVTCKILFFDCNTNTDVFTISTYYDYDLYPSSIIFNPLNNLVYCTALKSNSEQGNILIIDPTTFVVTENIVLNQPSVTQNYYDFTLALNSVDNTIFIATNMYGSFPNAICIFDCNTNEIISTNIFKVGTSDFSIYSSNVNIGSVFYNENYDSFVAFHFIYDTGSPTNGTAISSFTKQNSYLNEAFIPILESGVCSIVKYDCNINKVMETVYTLPAETPYVGKMVYNQNNNYLYFVQYETIIPFSGTKSIGVLNLENNSLVTTLYPTLINDPNNNGGTINTNFNIGTGVNGEVFNIQVDSDGKIFLLGNFSSYNGTSASNIIKLNSDASIDTSFVYGTGFSSATYCAKIQTDGKIIVGGSFTDYNGYFGGVSRIVRLNSDGSVDASFIQGTGFNGTVYAIAIQDDGKILVGGSFTSYNTNTARRIIRLNTDGSVDNSFTNSYGFDSRVLDIKLQSDGKILVGGTLFSYDFIPTSGIVRLNTDGSIDTSFVYGTGFSSETTNINIQSDGKIIVCGGYTEYNGTPVNSIIRLNSDGSVDTSFVQGTGFDTNTTQSYIQLDGKIIVVGNFSSYNGTTANGIIRLNSDGSVDTSFVYGTGFDAPTNCIAFLNADNILIGGQFSYYAGQYSNGIIDLYTISVSASDLIAMELNPFSNVIQIANTYSNGTTESGNIIVVDCNTNTISQYIPTDNGVEFLTYNSTLNTIAFGGFQNGGNSNFYFNSLTGTSNFTIDGGSVNYDFFVQGLNNDPKKIEEIELIMPQRYLANPVNVQYKDASGVSDLKPYLPNIEIDAFQKATNRAMVKFGDEYIMNINTQIVNFILPPLSTTTMIITYTELLKSDMLDVVIYEEERKAKYKINQSLEGKITATKYWGSKKMPKELSLSSDWLAEMRKRFKKVEVIEYDQPKLAGGTIQTREVYQDLFGFSKQVKAKPIGITKPKKIKKGVKVKLATKKQPIKPVVEDVQVEEVFQDMLRVNAHEIPLEKIIPTEMPIDKQPIKPKPIEMTTEQVFQEMLSVNAHEIKLNRIKVPKIKGMKPIQVQLDDLSPMDVFNRSFEDYGSGYLIGVKTPCKEEEKKDKYTYGVYYIKPIDDRFTAFRHSGEIPLKIELTTDWFNDLKRKFDDIQVIAIVKKRK